MRLILFSIFFVFAYSGLVGQDSKIVSGYIKEKGSKEGLIGVSIYLENSSNFCTSNTYGYYSLTIPAQQDAKIVFSMVGYQKTIKRISVTQNLVLDVELESINTLDEVVISAKRQEDRLSESSQMSKIELPVNQIKKIPSLLGEKDVLKVLQLMPGVQKGSEGQSGIYVRGGGPDQNLIILDDAIVYNANHLFGFFSTFNGDALKSVELTKGGFPARYGGRLSSVIELNMKDGNKEKFKGEGGIGLISSRMTLEGPVFNKKGSFLISGRRTYLDIVSKPFINARQKNVSNKVDAGYYFYDLNAKINYEIGAKDKIYLSTYLGKDKFNANVIEDPNEYQNGLDWGNKTATFRWNHLFGQKLFGNASLIYSEYGFGISSRSKTVDLETNKPQVFQLQYDSGIKDYTLKYDLDYFLSSKHNLKFGMQSIFHEFTPSATVLSDENIDLFQNKVEKINVTETGLYAEDNIILNTNFKINAGLRMSIYGAKDKSYFRPEPRISMAYKINKTTAIKSSYALMNQYVHLLSNTGIGLPTDLWVPSTAKISPQQSIQYAAGIAKDFEKQGLALSIEGYYKNMNNIISYKEGASFLVIDNPETADKFNWESQVTAGNGWSYGLEIMLQKKVGRFSGWTGYTWSKTEWKFQDLNFGNTFFPKYDRRHDLSIVGIYELNKKITLSATWVYGTGNALTIPLSEYTVYSEKIPRRSQNSIESQPYFGSNRVNEYSSRNTFRAENYHRLDAAVQFHKQKAKHERTWELGVYNAYNRKNPFFYVAGNSLSTASVLGGGGTQSQETGGQLVLKRYSLFPIVPSLTYNFKF